MEVPKKTKTRATISSSNSTPGYISRKNENTNSIRYMYPEAHSSTFAFGIYNNQDMEAIRLSTNKQLD